MDSYLQVENVLDDKNVSITIFYNILFDLNFSCCTKKLSGLLYGISYHSYAICHML